jgi:nucleotide-binding universal stress UspA family protein
MPTIKKILCPLDFSTPSYAALEAARALAANYDAELLLTHVVLFPAPNPRGLPSEQEAERFAQKEAELKLRALTGDKTRFVMSVGDPASEIVDTARAEGADLIVMSTHGLTGWRRFVIGSVTEGVLHQSPCPVLTVHWPPDLADDEAGCASQSTAGAPPSRAAFSLHKILCPTDFSEPSLAALATASELAAQFDAELCVLYVMEPLEPVLGIVSQEEFDASRSADAAQQIQQAVERRGAPGVRSRALVESGDPAAGILRAAAAEKVDLIVIATHGQTGWRRLVFGSVAAAVVRMARPPVLTVHAGAETTAADGRPAPSLP